jgi:starch phosphorylase
MEEDLRDVPDSRLWELRTKAREKLIEYVRLRVSRHVAALGWSDEDVENAKNLFDGNVLTLGFARRFATYKRPTLLLHDPERLARILTDPQRPVQLIVAGKAHPADIPAQAMIRQWTDFAINSAARYRVVFLTDHDMLMTQRLIQGVDVWINTPRRPWEACGTSGMKVLVNGGLNLSELDGWWAEAYAPELGWALGDGKEHDDDPAWDAVEADALYGLLEKAVIPEFYDRDGEGIPRAWVARMRESMARLSPRFSSNRAVRQYTEEYYIPAAESYLSRATNGCRAAVEALEWRREIESKWGSLRFGELDAETLEGGRYLFTVHVYLNGLDPDAISVQLYADEADEKEPFILEMKRGAALVGAANGYVYASEAPATRPAVHYTARIIPRRPGVAVPLEASDILWQK